MKMDWFSARMIPKNTDAFHSVTLTGQGRAFIQPALEPEDEPVSELAVIEEYHHNGRIEIQEYTLIPDVNGLFPFPKELGKRYDGTGQFAVYSIAWDGGEYLFRLNFE